MIKYKRIFKAARMITCGNKRFFIMLRKLPEDFVWGNRVDWWLSVKQIIRKILESQNLRHPSLSDTTSETGKRSQPELGKWPEKNRPASALGQERSPTETGRLNIGGCKCLLDVCWDMKSDSLHELSGKISRPISPRSEYKERKAYDILDRTYGRCVPFVAFDFAVVLRDTWWGTVHYSTGKLTTPQHFNCSD